MGASIVPRNNARISHTDEGGQVLLRPRVPTMGVSYVTPNDRLFGRVVWGKDEEAVAVLRDNRIVETVVGSRWQFQPPSGAGTAPTITPAFLGCFLIPDGKVYQGSGVYLTVVEGTPNKIYRSTNFGATWTEVYAMRSGAQPLCSQSWCIDRKTGYIYFGEYDTGSTATAINVLRSTDNGLTWSVWYTFPGPGTSDPNKVRHVHACGYDSVSERVYFSLGDSDPASGIYRVNAAGTGVEAVALNSHSTAQHGKFIRPIGLMFFPTAIALLSDQGPDARLFRIPRDQIGQANPTIEMHYTVGGAGWCTAKAATDGSRWLATVTSGPLDKGMHVYHVDDDGRRIYEVGFIPCKTDYGTLMPAGTADEQGTDGVVWWNSRDINRQPHLSMQTMVGRSTLPALALPTARRFARAITISSGRVTLTKGTYEEHIFGAIKVPANMRLLAIVETGVTRHSSSGGTDGKAQIHCKAYRRDTNAELSGALTLNGTGLDTDTTVTAVRGGYEATEYRQIVSLPADTIVEFALKWYAGLGATADCSGYYTVMFGEP